MDSGPHDDNRIGDATREDARTGYLAAIELVVGAEIIFWNVFSAMILVNAVLLGAMVVIVGQAPEVDTWISLLLTIAGSFINVVWAARASRTARARDYWMFSARKIEEDHLTPTVETLSRGARFAKGGPVSFQFRGEATPRVAQYRWIARRSSGQTPIWIMAGTFFIVYLGLFFFGLDR